MTDESRDSQMMLSSVSRSLAPTEEYCPSGSCVLPRFEKGWRRRRQGAPSEPEGAITAEEQ